MSPFRHAVFFRAVYDLAELPPDDGTEIAFAGRSNAGKSTAINALADHKRLAFTSKTPGRTQTINFFSLAPRCFLVDLPGYGYAAVPAKEKRHWALLVSTYLQTRMSLSGLVLIMDARHPFTALDRQLLDWLAPLHKRAHVLLTKADKLNRQEAMATLRAAEAAVHHYPGCSVQLFSGTTGLGVQAARKTLAQWLKK
ncbi:MAG: ribosome biogenesis GTP-binding protein YihA/YsxC [Burkholderiales bacterium]